MGPLPRLRRRSGPPCNSFPGQVLSPAQSTGEPSPNSFPGQVPHPSAPCGSVSEALSVWSVHTSLHMSPSKAAGEALAAAQSRTPALNSGPNRPQLDFLAFFVSSGGRTSATTKLSDHGLEPAGAARGPRPWGRGSGQRWVGLWAWLGAGRAEPVGDGPICRHSRRLGNGNPVAAGSPAPRALARPGPQPWRISS